MTITEKSFVNTTELLQHIRLVQKACKHDPNSYTDLNIYRSLIGFITEIALSHPQLLVKEFHERFSHAVGDKPDVSSAEIRELRITLMDEEYLNEYKPASDFLDMQGMFDGLLDLAWVTYGSGISFGFPMMAGMVEIYKSNMSKLGADGEPIYREDGKILKGPNFFKPDLKTILEKSKR